MSLLTLCLCVATFVIVLGIAVLLVWRRRRPEIAVILDAIDGARAQIDMGAKHDVTEHAAIAKSLEKANGRLVFLMSKDIAEELEEIAKATKAVDTGAPLDDKPK